VPVPNQDLGFQYHLSWSFKIVLSEFKLRVDYLFALLILVGLLIMTVYKLSYHNGMYSWKLYLPAD
jgi:hypothetical protein